jgi:hypothetical protein
MPGIIMETGLCGVRASSSSRKMTGHQEGIYASSTSADVGIHETDQNGLTLSPKIRSEKSVSLETCMITDYDLEETSRQLEAPSWETDERWSFFHPDAIYRARQHNLAPPFKKRRLAGELSEPLFENPGFFPVNGSGLVSFFTWTRQEKY